ncbi:MAG: O-GlcNAc transferase [bacterium]|nr:O-GlcNAc transferase [bacterium]
MPRAKNSKLSWQRKALYALFTTVAFFIGLELLLAGFGLKPITSDQDPLVGFDGSVSLLEEVRDSDDQAYMVTRDSKLVWFNPQGFAKVKKPGTKRVFCLGGSTTYGRPYSDSTSFCGWMRELLPLVDASVEWEVINAGGISYASYRVVAVMQELAQYQPDLFVVYSGQNEFLEERTYESLLRRGTWRNELDGLVASTRTYALLERFIPVRLHEKQWQSREILSSEVNERLNHTIGPADYQRDPVWAANVVEHYRINLHRMVQLAQEVGAGLLFVVPASNEKDCSPFKSQPKYQSSLAEIAQEDQVDFLRQEVAGDPLNADLHFRLGEVLFESEDYATAEIAFREAIEQDVCPLRATQAIQQSLREVCKATSTACLDFDQLLREKSAVELGHRILGKEYFLDHVHPTMEVHFDLAVWIIQDLQAAGYVAANDLKAPPLSAQMEARRQEVLSSLNQREHGVALRNLAKVLHWSGKFDLAADRASDALDLLVNDPESRFVLADSLKNTAERERAKIQYELLMQDTPNYARAYLPYGELLVSMGERERGLEYLLQAVMLEPNNAYANLQLGKFYVQQRDWRLAAEALSQALQIDPENRETRRLLDICSQGLRAVENPVVQ